VRRGAGDVVLLRTVTAAADTAAALLLYTVVASVWRNRLAGAIASAIYHLIPLQFAVLTTGNLTNAFAQAVAVVAMAAIGSGQVRMDRRGAIVLLTLILTAAYLSHTSTAALLFVAAIATSLLFLLRGGVQLRSAATAVAIATLIAAVVAVAIYYAHFLDTYQAEFARIGRETAANTADAGGRTAGGRLAGIPYLLRIYFGVAALVLAIFGGIRLLRRPAPDALTLTVGGWALSCALFLVIGILTPVDLRHYLAAVPVVAIAAGYGAAWAWNESPAPHRAWWRIGAALLLAATIRAGFEHWWNTLG
jgi:hypothetical protein